MAWYPCPHCNEGGIHSALSDNEKGLSSVEKLVICRVCRKKVRLLFEDDELRKIEPYE